MHPSMKTTLLLTAFLASSTWGTIAQTRFVGEDYTRYFNWHNEHSQIEKLYSPGSELYVFGDGARIYRQPDQNSQVLAQLQDGEKVVSRSDYRRAMQIPNSELNGYRDIWYKVANSQGVYGYVFGGHLAKGWRWADLNGDGTKELIMLGVSPIPRKAYNDIRAELRILSGQELLYNTTIAGLCVFEECDSSPMLRVLNNQPYQGAIMIEASTMTVGCYTGIERAFFYWNGRQLQSVFHAEYTVDLEYERQPFQVQDPQAVRTMMCSYKNQDQSFNPVWDCKEVETKAPADAATKKSPARARAR